MKFFKTIDIPHLGYKVHLQDLSKLQIENKTGSAYTMQIDSNSCCIFLEDIENTIKKPENFPLIAHETLHALQYIAQKRMFELSEEMEHGAYLLHFILNEILGYEYNV